jgi:hypothetical protein
MAKYRRTGREFRDIGRGERSFRDEVKDTDSIDAAYVEELRRKHPEPPAPAPSLPKVRLIKRGRRSDRG